MGEKGREHGVVSAVRMTEQQHEAGTALSSTAASLSSSRALPVLLSPLWQMTASRNAKVTV